MVRVLLVGFSPETEDFTDPNRPADMAAERVIADIEVGLDKIRNRGWIVERCFVRADEDVESARSLVEKRILDAEAPYDCIVIGGGIRLPSKYLVCEAIVNAIRKAAPTAAIGFNSRPDETHDAVDRQLKLGREVHD